MALGAARTGSRNAGFPQCRYINLNGATTMEATLRKWGNSPALRLPLALLREADMAPDERVSVTGRRWCSVRRATTPRPG